MRKIAFIVLVSLLSPAFLFAQEDHSQHAAPQKEKVVGAIKATGVIKKLNSDHLNAKHMTINIFHDPIAELKWPAMNMPFEVTDHTFIHTLKVGDKVNFEFVRKDGKNIIVKMSK